MGSKQIRIGQLIAPFGPGSIYTDRRGVPHVVAGLDHWYRRWDAINQKMEPCDDRSEFERSEPRLSALLHVDRFCLPPDYRHVASGQTPPPNAMLYVPALRFPRWYRHTKTGEMHRFNLHTTKIPAPSGGGRWQPVRFVAVCAAGHLCEFPWKEWIGCQCPGDGKLHLIDRGGADLSSVRAECHSCPEGSPGRRGRNLGGTTVKPDAANNEPSLFQGSGISCPGDRPWLGEDASEPGCQLPLVGALINQTNIYFPRTLAAISLPDLTPQSEETMRLRAEIEAEQECLGLAMSAWKMGKRRQAAAMLKTALNDRGMDCDLADVEAALESLLGPGGGAPEGTPLPANPEPELLAFRRVEFNIIRNPIDDPEHVPNLRVIQADVPKLLTPWLARVNLVERLRETRVFYGFDRLDPGTSPLAEMPDSAMTQLFRHPPAFPSDRWLPAVEVFGEGIYLELREDSLIKWQADNSSWLKQRLTNIFIADLCSVFQTLPPLGPADRDWGSRYLLVHSLAHVLINQLVFECGYSTASLRERLYISPDPKAPMAGALIYTAAGDSEGTLGGLVRLGRPERLGPVFARALGRASWCSADPVCSEKLGGRGSRRANLAACHACILLPETSCETINQGLDRAMVVGTPEDRDRGFFAELLQGQYATA